MKDKSPGDVTIGKFDILATYAYAKARLDGLTEAEAKERGMVAAIMGAKARLGHRGGTLTLEHDKKSAEKKKKATITAQSFDRQVADKMGGFFEETFLPSMTRLVESGLSYAEVKRLAKIPPTWGAKISGEKFKGRTARFL